MVVVEIGVAFLFVLRVKIRVVGIAGLLADGVEMPGVFFKEVIRGQVLPPAEPLVGQPALLPIELKVPPVGVYRGHHRVARVQHQAQPAGKEVGLAHPEILLHGNRQGPVHGRDVHPALFKDGPVFDDPGTAAPAFGALPQVFAEAGLAIFGLQGPGNAVLEGFDIAVKPILHSLSRPG